MMKSYKDLVKSTFNDVSTRLSIEKDTVPTKPDDIIRCLSDTFFDSFIEVAGNSLKEKYVVFSYVSKVINKLNQRTYSPLCRANEIVNFGFVIFCDSYIGNIIQVVLAPYYVKEIKPKWDSNTLASYVCDGIKFYSYVNCGYSFYVKKDELKSAIACIKKLLLTKYGDQQCVSSQGDGTQAVIKMSSDHSIVNVNDDIIMLDTVASIARKKEKFAILIYGEPGTGKSVFSRLLAKKLAKSYVRFDLSSPVSTHTFVKIAEFLQPDCIIIDDIDRSLVSPGMLISTIDSLRQHTKYIIASANNLKSIDPAARRPGRFDFVMPLQKLDESVRRSVLGDELMNLYGERLESWSISYLADLAHAYKNMSEEEAATVYMNLWRRWRAEHGKLRNYMSNVMIVDGMNFFHRARSGFDRGENSVIFNFMRNFRFLVEQLKPTRIYFVLEGKPKKRKALFDSYKLNRVIEPGSQKEKDMMPFYRQVNETVELLMKYFPVSVIRHPENECDDVIFNMINRSSKTANWTVVSNDSDFKQLLDCFDNVRIYNPMKKEYVERDEYNYVTWKSLRGDPSDNIPKVDGMTDAKAAKIASDASLLEIFLTQDKVTLEQFERNWNLITFETWSDEDANKLVSSSPERDWSKVKEMFEFYGFASLVKEKPWEKFVSTFDPLWGQRVLVILLCQSINL